MLKIAILGYGVVGSGVAEVISNHAETFKKKVGFVPEIGYILDIRDFTESPYKNLFVKDYGAILSDPEVLVVVECIGGIEPAYGFVRRALESGRSVVTSNKELVAERGDELLELARDNCASFLFEGSVGGGVPIIRPMHQCLIANEFTEITGILNGTTNFILTAMSRGGGDFNEALDEAKRLGYAEANPMSDIEGTDTCRKICILASLACGRHVYPREAHTEGISGVGAADIKNAEAWGGRLRLLGSAKRLPSGLLHIITAPHFVPLSNPLAGVEGVYNGILVKGDAIGDVMFYGRGAGKYPTASAVTADIIDALKNIEAPKYAYWRKAERSSVAEHLDCDAKMCVRVRLKNETGSGELLQRAAELFRGAEPLPQLEAGEASFITGRLPERELADAAEQLVKKALAEKILSMIRILE